MTRCIRRAVALPLISLSAAVFATTAKAATRYVDADSTNPTAPYTDISMAARNIQDAVDASQDGDLVLVADGTYDSGGRAVHEPMTNRVAIDRAITVHSMNGPEVTFIEGVGPRGAAGVRCAYVGDGALLAGFTLTNGASHTTGDYEEQRSGGGALCADSGVVSNCHVVGCSASYGGGIRNGSAFDTTLADNTAYVGGGSYYCDLTRCIVAGNSATSVGSTGGGGLRGGTITDCTISNNTAIISGGGAENAVLRNCTLSGNSAIEGGGAQHCTLEYCLLAGNVAERGGGLCRGSAGYCDFIGNVAIENGGAVYADRTGATVTNCTLTLNVAVNGGGIYNCDVANCVVWANAATYGGGMQSGEARNCTFVHNEARRTGGGASYSELHNCIVYYNKAPIGSNHYESVFAHSCTFPLAAGAGNMDSEPQLLSPARLAADSPCRGAGSSAHASGTDLDGEAWLNPPSIGCDEVVAGNLNGPLTVSISASSTHASTGFPIRLTATVDGKASEGVWDLGDGTTFRNRFSITHAYPDAGIYEARFTAYNESHPGGVAARLTIRIGSRATHYVAAGSTTAAAPYTSWATAATNIQDAIAAAEQSGALVLVSNGVYETGGVLIHGTVTNRIAVTNGLTVRSVNGRGAATIVGQTTRPYVRCAYVGNGATLSGFTLERGAAYGDSEIHDGAGGGAWMESGARLSDCTVVRCKSGNYGGGLFGGAAEACTVTNSSCSRYGGGAADCTLHGCRLVKNSAKYGGGAFSGTLYDCTIDGNYANQNGGGAAECLMYGCLVTANRAGEYGGGTSGGGLEDCTLSMNRADYGGASHRGGLSGCTLTANRAYNFGGGAYLSGLVNCSVISNTAWGGGGAVEATLKGCRVAANEAEDYGGGARNCKLDGCVVVENFSRTRGGGVSLGSANNCTITRNRALVEGGGTWAGTVRNCIIWDNRAPENANCSGGAVQYSCTTPLMSGEGNTAQDPLLASDSHLSRHSPCIGAGFDDYATGVDIDGETWSTPPAMGCDEYHAGDVTGALAVAIQSDYTNAATGTAIGFSSDIRGMVSASRWSFGDGTVVSNAACVSHAWVSQGTYEVTLTAFNDDHPAGVTANLDVSIVHQPIYYVDADGTSPASPYSSREQAATNIQSAIDVAVPGGTVLVLDGIYASGNREAYGPVKNRIVIDRPIVVRGFNGADTTTIVGGSGTRCAYVEAGATLEGFTLRDGSASSGLGSTLEKCGGGAWCEPGGAAVKHCVIVDCYADGYGGGVYGGNLSYCTLRDNSSYRQGGGAYESTLTHSFIAGNAAVGSYDYSHGGGAYACTLTNCVLVGNQALKGGGAYGGTLLNCTITGNEATYGGGGMHYGAARNCVVYHNSSNRYTNWYSGVFTYTCTVPLPEGAGNILHDPLFVASNDFRLAIDSPCVDMGDPSCLMAGVDMDGAPRIANGVIDMGAFEYQWTDSDGDEMPDRYEWLTIGNTTNLLSHEDTDGDGLSNGSEFLAGSAANDPSSCLVFEGIDVEESNRVVITWQCARGKRYSLYRAEDRPGMALAIATNIPASPPFNTVTDIISVVRGSAFYSVTVE